MGAAGTALGAADARTNEHYEIGTILTQFSHGASCGSRIGHNSASVAGRVPAALDGKVIYLHFQNPDVHPPARRFRQGDGSFDAPPDWAENSQGISI